MERKDTLPIPQEPPTGICPEADKLRTNPYALFL